MGFFNLYFNETMRPINAKYSIPSYYGKYSCIKTTNPAFFFEDRYKTRLLKLKNKKLCCDLASK